MLRKKNVYGIVLLLVFAFKGSYAQKACCDSIVSSPETLAQYGTGAQDRLKFSTDSLIPVIAKYNKETGQIVSSLKAKLTIDCMGKVVDAIVINTGITDGCKKKLVDKFKAMNAWEPALMHNEKVCSFVYFPIICIKWQ